MQEYGSFCGQCGKGVTQAGATNCGHCGSFLGDADVSSTQQRSFPGGDLAGKPTVKFQPHDQGGCTPRFRTPVILLLVVIVVLVILGSVWGYLATRPQPTPVIAQQDGIAIHSVDVNGQKQQIGISDGTQGLDPFVSNDPSQEAVLRLIFDANKAIGDKNYFTVIVAATLSNSSRDNNQSEYIGVEQLRGAYLAQKAYNKEHAGLAMKLLIANIGNKLSAEQTAPYVMRQIITYAKTAQATGVDHFVGVEGFPFSQTALAGLPTLNPPNQPCIPVVSSSASTDQLSQKHCFRRIISSNSVQNPYIVRFLGEVLKPDTVLLSADLDDTYSKNFGDLMENELGAKGYTFKRIDYRDTSQSLQDLLSQLKRMPKPDIWLYTGYPTQLNKLREMAAVQNIALPTVVGGGALYETGAYKTTARGSQFTDIYLTASAYGNGPTAEESNFLQTYQATYDPQGQYPNNSLLQAMLEFDGVTAFEAAVADVSDITKEAIEQSLETLKFQGVTGPINYNKGGLTSDPGAGKPLYVLCANNGVVHWIVKYIGESSQTGEDRARCAS